MKFKVGDKVKLVSKTNCTYGFDVGDICRITKIGDIVGYYKIEIDNGKYKGYVSEENLKQVGYTYEDLKKSPIGTKITFEDGDVLVKLDENYYRENRQCGCYRSSRDLIDLKDNFRLSLGKITKIEEPEYQTVYEVKEEVLDEAEKRYLRGVIRPFRDKVKTIRKTDNTMNGKDNEYLTITLREEPNMDFPNFEPNTMYKGMELYKEYTLKELGL